MKIYGVEYCSLGDSYGCTYFSSKQEAQKYIDVMSYVASDCEEYYLKEFDVNDKCTVEIPKYVHVSAEIYDGILGKPTVIWGDMSIPTRITDDSIVFSMGTEGVSSKELMDKVMETAEKLLKARVN